MSFTHTIRGVPVIFPFEPYGIQKDYMEKVLECLQNETNGILESPTGTGKTLSLLCSSLAWLRLKKAEIQAHNFNSNSGIAKGEFDKCDDIIEELNLAGNMECGRRFMGMPTIIYASRTHSQLTQAMQELKRTAYADMKGTVIGSREQTCINPQVMTEPQSAKVHVCKLKVQTRTCYYYLGVEKKKSSPEIASLSIVDIEDMVKLGQRHKFCPYYMAKQLKQYADIIFMPYNYLLDPRARKAFGVELTNNIVILDEAHNVDKVCEESASIQIKSTDITLCIEEVTEVMKALEHNVEMPNSQKDFCAEDLCVLKQIMLDFEKAFDEVKLQNSSEGTTLSGTYIFELFGKAGIDDKSAYNVINLIDKIVTFLQVVNSGPFQRKGNGLDLFGDLLRIAYSNVTKDFKDKIEKCYKVHIDIEEVKKKNKFEVNTWLSKGASSKTIRVLNYWCFSPGFGMNMLKNQGTKSIILTSGTLAPLKPLISELEMDIRVTLENPHIVKTSQVCIKIVAKGPDNEPLNCSYQNRDNPKYMNSLGCTINNICRISPDGMLIFFPSYPIMQKCQDYWQQNSSIWSEIANQKPIFVEPRTKDAFNSAMEEYYSKIRNPQYRGAIFMGVCRGKVSEGMDFADQNGRTVIITGLPYPPMKDPRVILKKRYLDVCNSRDKEYLKGDEWYSLEATRAVNQAIGRVIRHQNDYGAILLLDARFNNPRIISKMSLWLRHRIQLINNFGELIRDLRNFFKNAEINHPLPQLEKVLPKTEPVSASFDTISSYKKKGNFDFSTSASCSSLNGTSDESSDNLVMINSKRPVDFDSFSAPKKKKILIRKEPSETEQPLKTETKEYITMVRNMLDPENYQRFVSAIGIYTKNLNFREFSEILDEIFIPKPNLRFLIKGLDKYVKKNDVEEFEKYWCKMR